VSLGFALKIKQKRAWFLPGFSGYPEAPTGFMPVEPMILCTTDCTPLASLEGNSAGRRVCWLAVASHPIEECAVPMSYRLPVVPFLRNGKNACTTLPNTRFYGGEPFQCRFLAWFPIPQPCRLRRRGSRHGTRRPFAGMVDRAWPQHLTADLQAEGLFHSSLGHSPTKEGGALGHQERK